MHQHAKTPDEFAHLVSVLKGEEKKAQLAVEEAKQKAAEIGKEAREKAIEISTAAQDEAVSAKNGILAAGKAKIEEEAGKILTGAHAEAKKLRSEKIKPELAKSLAAGLVSRYLE